MTKSKPKAAKAAKSEPKAAKAKPKGNIVDVARHKPKAGR